MLHVLESFEDAEEATQQVMLRLLEGLPTYRQTGKPFMAWAFAIAHNHAFDVRRRRDRTVAMEPRRVARAQELAGGGTAAAIPRDEHRALRELIAPLSTVQRQVLTLIYECDLSPEQIASVLGRTPASVRQEHRRARERLRQIVIDESRRVFSDTGAAVFGSPGNGERSD